MLHLEQKYPQSFKCSHCGAGMSICSIYLMPGDIKIARAEIVIRSSQQRFKISEEDYDLLLEKFRNISLVEKVIRISCFACEESFCELSHNQSAWINGILETNAIKFCRT